MRTPFTLMLCLGAFAVGVAGVPFVLAGAVAYLRVREMYLPLVLLVFTLGALIVCAADGFVALCFRVVDYDAKRPIRFLVSTVLAFMMLGIYLSFEWLLHG